MKHKRTILFWGILSACLIGLFWVQYHAPQMFVWEPTYDKYDKQPFGSYVFDDVASSSLDNYRLENKTFYRLSQDYRAKEADEYAEDYADKHADDAADERIGVLLTEKAIDFTAADAEALLYLVKRGHKVMLCLTTFPSVLCDSLRFYTANNSHFSSMLIKQYIKEGNQRDSLIFGTDPAHPEQIYSVYPHLHPGYLKDRYHDARLVPDSGRQADSIVCDSLETLVWDNNRQPVVMRLFMGAGELFLVSTPLLFTNYGILDGNNASYVFRLLAYMQDMPVVRLEAYGINNQESLSPLRYFLSQPPLRWALYLTMLVIILCMIFSAKRRQRVIPVVRPPANQTLRFTRLIGNLYYQKRDYQDMLRKKHMYFCAEVNRLNGLDLQSDEPDEALCRRLAEKMAVDMSEVWPDFRALKHLLQDGRAVTEQEMMQHVDLMNKWIHNLYT